MTMYSGKDVRVFLSTEHTEAGILTDSYGEPSTNTSSFTSSGGFVPPRADANYLPAFTASAGRIINIESLELNIAPVNDESDLVGRQVHEVFRMKEAWDVTLNLLMSVPSFDRIYDVADNGVSGTTSAAAFRTSTQERNTTDGYRLYIWLTANECYTLKLGTLESVKITPAANKNTREAIKFSGNIYTLSNAYDTSSVTSAEL